MFSSDRMELDVLPTTTQQLSEMSPSAHVNKDVITQVIEEEGEFEENEAIVACIKGSGGFVRMVREDETS